MFCGCCSFDGVSVFTTVVSVVLEEFIGRFEQIENEVLSEGKELSDYSLEELDAMWGKNKKK